MCMSDVIRFSSERYFSLSLCIHFWWFTKLQFHILFLDSRSFFFGHSWNHISCFGFPWKKNPCFLNWVHNLFFCCCCYCLRQSHSHSVQYFQSRKTSPFDIRKKIHSLVFISFQWENRKLSSRENRKLLQNVKNNNHFDFELIFVIYKTRKVTSWFFHNWFSYNNSIHSQFS